MALVPKWMAQLKTKYCWVCPRCSRVHETNVKPTGQVHCQGCDELTLIVEVSD